MNSSLLRESGKYYRLPSSVEAALERVFDESVGAVRVIELSRYARLHPRMTATTRPNRILLSISGEQFIARPELVLHEFFHVLRQWGTGSLTRWRYLTESFRRGYWDNRFEREAREFTASNLERYLAYLQRHHLDDRFAYFGISPSRE
jgi:hypothetical protein